MYIHVYTGLTSRCVTLADVYYLLKKAQKKRLTIIWQVDDICNISFYDIFSRDMFCDLDIKVIELKGKYYNINKFIPLFLDGKYLEACKSILKMGSNLMFSCKERFLKAGKVSVDYDLSNEEMSKGRTYLQREWRKLKFLLPKTDDIYVHAYCGIIRDNFNKIDYSVIKFKEEYYRQVERMFFGKRNVIGVHIRRTDHVRAIKTSKIYHFTSKMDEILKTNPDACLFLATDDKRVEKQLCRLYGDKIITQSGKQWGRDTLDGMKSAIIDLLALSRCEFILGSYYSAFSAFAAKYGEKELIICKEDGME